MKLDRPPTLGLREEDAKENCREEVWKKVEGGRGFVRELEVTSQEEVE
jgi:hypothetical protein